MQLKYRPIVATLVVLPLAIANLGTGCSLSFPSNPPVIILPPDAVDIVFLNSTDFDVEAIVNDGSAGTILAHTNTDRDPLTLSCLAGDLITISGDLLADNGIFPSPSELRFFEGTEFFCGDVIHVEYFLDENGDLSQDGVASE